MTVRIHDPSFVSEAAAAKNPQNYLWYQVTRGKVLLDSSSKQFDVELTKGDKFGIKRTKTAFYLLDADDLTVHFKLSPADFEKVMKNSKGFSGDIAGAPVRPGTAEGTPLIGKSELADIESLINKAKGEIADGFNPIGKNPKLNAPLMSHLKALNKLILKHRKAGTKLPSPVEKFAKKYGLGEVGASDFMARLRNPKDGASIKPDNSRRPSMRLDPASRKLVFAYEKSYHDLVRLLTSNLEAEIQGKPPRYSKSSINRALRVVNATASAALKAGVVLPKSPVLDHYGFGNVLIKDLLSKPDFDIEGARSSTKNLRKDYIKLSLADLRAFSAIIKKTSSENTPSLVRSKEFRRAENALNVLEHNKVAIPKSSARAVEYVNSYSRKRNAPATKEKQTKQHPGLEVKQGAVPKQDKKGEAAKRITDKNMISFLKKQGVEIEKTKEDDLIARGRVTTATITKLKSAFSLAGWNIDTRAGGSYTSRRGAGQSFKSLYFEFPGAKRFMTIKITGSDKGLLQIKDAR